MNRYKVRDLTDNEKHQLNELLIPFEKKGLITLPSRRRKVTREIVARIVANRA